MKLYTFSSTDGHGQIWADGFDDRDGVITFHRRAEPVLVFAPGAWKSITFVRWATDAEREAALS